MLNWANQFNIFCFLDNNQYISSYHSYECLLAVGAKKKFSCNNGDAFGGLKKFFDENPDWLFGHFSYDIKNQIEELNSQNPDHLQFDETFFFVPEIILRLDTHQLSILADGNAAALFHDIFATEIKQPSGTERIEFKSRFSRSEYLETIQRLKHHIHSGDCYEINFCQEFYAEQQQIDPQVSYQALSKISPNPFACFYKLDQKFVLCASPERYLKKIHDLVISQPIKGTSSRNLNDKKEDIQNKQNLKASNKERSENVMVVDLVRNDLSKVCKEGTVSVEELFGIYSFPQVHQMISTISGKVRDDLHWTELVRATFPMGSMTGAPKKRVMELIEEYEKSKRGLFSGTIGYVTPEADFDFNVVIRSILYNQENHYVSYQVGSGITFLSDPEKEYEECMIKAEAIKKVLA